MKYNSLPIYVNSIGEALAGPLREDEIPLTCQLQFRMHQQSSSTDKSSYLNQNNFYELKQVRSNMKHSNEFEAKKILNLEKRLDREKKTFSKKLIPEKLKQKFLFHFDSKTFFYFNFQKKLIFCDFERNKQFSNQEKKNELLLIFLCSNFDFSPGNTRFINE